MDSTEDRDILKHALIGYESELATINSRMASIKTRLGIGAAMAQVSRPKRRLSEEARKRISMAQKKRWKRDRAEKAAAASATE